MNLFSHRSCLPLAKAKATNATDSSYPSRPPTTTVPVDDGVVSILQETTPTGGPVFGNMVVMPYVLGADGNTFSCRVIGWSNAIGLWVPSVIAEYDCTAGNVTGVAGATVLNTEFFADTLALVANMGTDAQGTEKVSPVDNTPGRFTIRLDGFQKIEFLFKKGAGTSANALYRAY